MIQIKTLKEIRLQKADLLTKIRQDSKQMDDLWNQLVHNEENNVTPSAKIIKAVSSGTNVVDGLILGWKLYNKFGKGRKRTGNGKKEKPQRVFNKLFRMFGK